MVSEIYGWTPLYIMESPNLADFVKSQFGVRRSKNRQIRYETF